MAFMIKFFYEDGENVMEMTNVKDMDFIKYIMKLQVYDIVPLGSGVERKNYRVKKIRRRGKGVSDEVSGKDEFILIFEITVEDI